MKKILIFLLLTVVAVQGQSRGRRGATLAKFGMAAGFTANYVVPKLDGLNAEMRNSGMPEFASGLFTYGASGYVYVLFVPNLRLGGTGYGGSMSVNSGNKSARVALSGGGLTVEYSLPQIKFVAFSLGAIIGGGKLSLDLYETNGSQSWDGVWNEFNTTAENKHANISSAYFLFAPVANVEIMLNRFAALRIGAGWQFAIGESWEIYDGETLSGVPSDFGASGFFFSAGILVGLFVF